MRRLLAPCLAVLVLTAGCGSSSSGSSSGTASRTPSSAATLPPSAAPSASSSTPAAPDAQVLTLTVKGNTVTGDTGTVPVRIGHPVHLTVTSDVADEVHVHGADVSADVAAGGTVVIDFVQQAPGRFEIELEKRKRVLTRLQVS